MTKVAWQLKKDEIQKEIPGMTRKRFLYHLSHASYNRHWTSDYRRPRLFTRLLALPDPADPENRPVPRSRFPYADAANRTTVYGQLQRVPSTLRERDS